MNLKSNFSFILVRALELFLSFAVFVALARVLEPNDYGQLLYSKLIASTIFALASLGVDNLIISMIGGKSCTKTASNIALLYFVRMFVFIVINIIFVVLADLPVSGAYILLTLTYLFQLLFFGRLFFLAEESGHQYLLTYLKSLLLALTFGYIVYEQSSLSAIYILLGIPFVTAALQPFFSPMFPVVANLRLEFDKSLWLSRVMPIFVATLGVIAYTKFDQFLVALVLNDMAYAKYGIAVQLSEPLSIIPISLCAQYIPALKRSLECSRIDFELALAKLLKLIQLYAFAVSAFVFIFGRELLALLYGEAYSEAYVALSILTISKIFSFSGVCCSAALIVLKLEKVRLKKILVGLVISAVSLVFLVPVYGIAGAAISVLIGQMFGGVISSYFFSPSRPLGLIQVKSLFLR